MYIYVYTYLCAHMHVAMYAYVCMYIFMHACMHVFVRLYIHADAEEMIMQTPNTDAVPLADGGGCGCAG